MFSNNQSFHFKSAPNMSSSPLTHHIRHPLAHPKGGILLNDEGGVTSKAFKNFAANIAKKLFKGQINDMLKTSTPSIIHFPRTFLENACVAMSTSSQFMT